MIFVLNKGSNAQDGSKATLDIDFYIEKLGGSLLSINIKNEQSKLQKWNYYRFFVHNLKNKLNKGDILLVQYPLYIPQFITNKIIKKCKKLDVKLIALIHDVNSLRSTEWKKREFIFFKTKLTLKDEIHFLNQFDYVIAPTSAMAKVLQENGLKSKIGLLEIYDYQISNYKEQSIQFEKVINFAGNLNKSLFLDELNQKNIGINFNLYGPISNKNRINHLDYLGSFPSDELIQKMNSGFGLVWDGERIDGISGMVGEYMKYNSPHKLSLYLAIGMPVIVWKQSAMYDFVKEHNVGFGVDSLYELKDILENITENEFNKLACNAQKIGVKLRDGFYIKKAIKELN